MNLTRMTNEQWALWPATQPGPEMTGPLHGTIELANGDKIDVVVCSTSYPNYLLLIAATKAGQRYVKPIEQHTLNDVLMALEEQFERKHYDPEMVAFRLAVHGFTLQNTRYVQQTNQTTS